MKRDTWLVLLVLIVLVLAGCQGDQVQPTATAVPAVEPTAEATAVAPAGETFDPGTLTANPWQWVSFTGPVDPFDVEMPASYTLTFNEDGTVNIVADCNNADGTYTEDAGNLTIDVGPMTMAACPSGSRSDQFIELLRGAAIAFLEDGNLHIDLMADGGTLAFAPANTAVTEGIPAQSLVGTYQFRPIDEEDDADYFLVLNADSTAEIDERPIGSTDPAEVKADAIGTWTADGATVLFDATEVDGEPVAQGEFIVRIAFENGFPVLTDIKVGDYFASLDNTAFSIGAGQQGPLVREVQERLAGIDYLGFADPGTDVYDEETRKAVVAFQVSQGLHPNGVVDEETWRLLFQGPQTPLPTPTPLESAPLPADEAPAAGQLTATTTESVNLRSGPGTQYVRLTTVDPGTAFDVTGRNTEATWVQIAYPDSASRAWVSGEYVTLSGDLASVPVAGLETEAAPEAEPTTGPAEAAGSMGTPNLDILPTHTEDGRPIVYFTFDDGPQPNTTDVIADLFEQYGGTATYFMVGTNVLAHPNLVRYATTKGHYIADHTWDHGDLAGMTRQQFVDEVERTREAIIEVAGDLFYLDRDVRYVRPPYGSTDANTRQYAANQGMAVVLWTIDPQDWRRPGADVIANHILSHVQPGSIVLSHDGGGDRTQTIEAYRTVLPELAEQGYVFRNIFTP